MNPFDLSFNLADSPLIGMLVGLLLWSIAAVLVFLLVELVCFLWLTIRAMNSNAVAGKP
jgi:hypothetical protein